MPAIHRIAPLRHGTETIVNDLLRLRFDGLRDFAMQSAEPVDGAATRGSLTHEASEAWDLDAGLDGTRDLAMRGWPEGLARIRERMDELETAIPHRPAPVRGHAVTGGRVCVPTYLAGSPRHFERRDADEAPRESLRLLVAGSMPANFSADHALNRGAAIASCVDELEGRGTRTEVVMHMGARDSHAALDLEGVIKRPEAPLDLDALTMALAHVGTLRRLGFAIMEQYRGSGWDHLLRHAYGTPLGPLSRDPDTVAFPMPHQSGHWVTSQSALRSVLAMLPQLTQEVAQ